MKKATTFIFAISISTSSFAADQNLQELIEADAQKDPYAIKSDAYMSNEHGDAAQPPADNSFEVEVGTPGSDYIPSETELKLQEKRESWQKYNSRYNKIGKTNGGYKRNNVNIPDYEYDAHDHN